MPLPAKVTWVTFDVYGTLIDWEAGILDAFQREAQREGFTLAGAGEDLPALPRAASTRSRAAPTSSTPRCCAAAPSRSPRRSAGRSSPRAAASCPDSMPRWRPFKETNTQLTRFGKKFSTGLISNIDDKLLGETRRHIPHVFDLVVTAQQVRSYKPDSAHFTEFARRVGSKKNWVHICSGVHADLEPCAEGEGPDDLGQPQEGAARPERQEADRRGQDAARGGQAARRRVGAAGAPRCGSSRSTRTCCVCTSAFWQTNCTVVRGPGGRGPRRPRRS